jgi:DNA-binding transcriptional LysR family regulator
VAFDQIATALASDEIDAAVTRLPVDKNLYYAVPLYVDSAVVVVPKDHLFAALGADEAVVESDLALENVFDYSERGITAKEAVEWVAAEVGVTVMAMSLARLYHRKDVTYRLVTGLVGTEMGLVWLKSKDGPMLQELAGIVRGRSAKSTRGFGAGGDGRAADGAAGSGEGAVSKAAGSGSPAVRSQLNPKVRGSKPGGGAKSKAKQRQVRRRGS